MAAFFNYLDNSLLRDGPQSILLAHTGDAQVSITLFIYHFLAPIYQLIVHRATEQARQIIPYADQWNRCLHILFSINPQRMIFADHKLILGGAAEHYGLLGLTNLLTGRDNKKWRYGQR